MKWLLILIALFKFIGIAFLLLLSLILIILLILLLCSIKYEAEGNYNNGKGKGRGYFSWLFGIIKADFSFENNKFDYKIKIPFVNLNEKENKVKKVNNISDSESSDDRIVTIMSENNDTNNQEKKPNVKSEAEIKNKKTNLFRKKKIKSKKSKNNNFNIKKLMNYYKEYEVKKLYIPVMNFFKRFLKALNFKGKADIIFGFDDPSTTGMVLGMASMVTPFFPIKLDLKGNFENEYLFVDCNLNGKTCALFLIVPVIKLIFDKHVWKLLMKLKG